jgi:cell division protein FtsB
MRQVGHDSSVVARLVRVVTPPRLVRRYRDSAAFRRQVRRAAAWAGLCALAYAFLFADGGLASILWRRWRIRELQHRVVELERRQSWLERELALRQDDRDMIERLARERYGMAYPGEKVYRIVEVSESEAQRIEHEKRRLERLETNAAPESRLETRR